MTQEKHYKKTKAMNMNQVDGTTIHFDSKNEYHINHDGYDELIDKVMNDVNGEMFITSRGVADLMDLEHHNLLKKYLEPMLKDNYGRGEQLLPNDKLNELRIDFKQMFVESVYVGRNNAQTKQYVISPIGFQFIINSLPKSRRSGVNELRAYVSLRIIKRFEEYRQLTINNKVTW